MEKQIICDELKLETLMELAETKEMKKELNYYQKLFDSINLQKLFVRVAKKSYSGVCIQISFKAIYNSRLLNKKENTPFQQVIIEKFAPLTEHILFDNYNGSNKRVDFIFLWKKIKNLPTNNRLRDSNFFLEDEEIDLSRNIDLYLPVYIVNKGIFGFSLKKSYSKFKFKSLQKWNSI